MRYFVGNNIFPYKDVQDATLEEVKEYLKTCNKVVLDIETGRKFKKGIYREDVYKPGLDPYVSKVVMIQIGDERNQYIIDARQFSRALIKYALQDCLEDRDILVIGHNLKFEGKFFLHHFNIRLLNVWDTMIVEKVLYNGFNHGYSLEALMSRYFGTQAAHKVDLFSGISKAYNVASSNAFMLGTSIDIDQIQAQAEQELLDQKFIDKSTRMGFINIGDTPFNDKQINYGYDDIDFPLKIYNIQCQGRGSWNPKVGIAVENGFTQVLSEAELQGVPFDQEAWLNAYDKALKSYNDRLTKLNDYIISNVPEFASNINLFSNEPVCNIKWSSSKQVVALYKHWKCCPKEKSKSTGRLEYTVGAKALFSTLPSKYQTNFYRSIDVEITDITSFTLQYLLFKKAEQLCTTFGKEWLKYVHPITYKVHTNYNQYMISSRLSSSNPNLQQIPGTRDYRDCFTAEWLINSDFASQELRIAAEVHGVPKMIDFFKTGDEYFGEDLHSFNATQMFKVIHQNPDYVVPPKEFADGTKNPEFTKQHGKERDAAKTLGFLLNYGKL